MNEKKKINFTTFLSVYFRSFFLQGSFSAKYCQNTGFLLCMEPVGKKLYDKSEEIAIFRQRHSEYYNGNPFMTPLVLGAVINLEERMSNGDNVSEEEIRRFKKIVGPAVGSAGDRFFWGSLRPFAILCGVLTAFLYGFWGVLAFFAVYNIPTIILRYYWLNAGYNLGPKVVIEIKNPNLELSVKIMETAGSILVGAATVLFISGNANFGIASLFSALAFTGGSLILLKKNIPLYLVFPFAIVVALIIALIK